MSTKYPNERRDAKSTLFAAAMAVVMMLSLVAMGTAVIGANTQEEGATITGTVTYWDGEPADGASVYVEGEDTDEMMTDPDGTFEFWELEPGTYTVWADHGEMSSQEESVTVEAGQTESVDLVLEDDGLEEMGTIAGTVLDGDDEPIEGAEVWAEGDTEEDVFGDDTDADGSFEFSVEPGTYTVSATHGDISSGAETVTVDAGGTETVTLAIEEGAPDEGAGYIDSDYVVDTSVEHVGGTEPTELPDVDVMDATDGQINVDLMHHDQEDTPQELAGLGVDETTEFEITLEFEDFTPRAAVTVGENVEWDRDGSTMTITAKPLESQWIDDDVSFEDWPEGDDDQADVAYEAMVSLLVLNLDFAEDEFEPEEHPMDGMTVATDAQAFSTPQYVPGEDGEPDELSIWIAGPHLTVDGEENEGIYQALLPNGLLDTWGVEDADELDAAYKGDPADFDTIERDDGIMIDMDVSYSAGQVEIRPDVESDDDPTIDDYTEDGTDEVTMDGFRNAIGDLVDRELGIDVFREVLDRFLGR